MERNSRKIVSAYPVGRLHGGGHEGGVERMRCEVSTLIGFRPDFISGWTMKRLYVWLIRLVE
ncbi:MAG: hypothetical protein FWE34_00675 [Defluviitaleaceae bacterium]|nr:hypothetical protein [Defluviitaleaceae bacterium]